MEAKGLRLAAPLAAVTALMALAVLACGAPASPGTPAALPAATPEGGAGLAPTAAAASTAPPATQAEAPAAMPDAPVDCTGEAAVGMAEAIAESYQADADVVLAWHCAGSRFEDILLALETSDQAGAAVETLLARRAQGDTWDDIWEDLGLFD
jgi:hypothetical protein